jgi:hypothetical protein
VGFGLDRRAKSRKGRGLFRRAPNVREIGDRLGWLVRRMERAALIRAAWHKDRFVVELGMHSAAPHVMLALAADGEISVGGSTSSIGPGYHADVIARIDPILAELDYVWTDTPGDVPAAMCAWLAGELRSHDQVRLVERPFRVDAPVLTMMGPRDAAWRDAVLADPKRSEDAFAWWQTGAGHAARARALLAMWHEVPWREPIDSPERTLLEQVDADLRIAHRAELELPWPEWAAILGYLGKDDVEIRQRAGDRVATIGYRRYDLDVELSGGWTITLGGGFVGAWEDEGGRYWATDGDRAIEFTSLTATDETDSDRLLGVAPERHAVIARFTDDARRGRAEAYDDDDVHVVHGLMTCAPHVAILTCKGGDEAWALATWRSLRRGP